MLCRDTSRGRHSLPFACLRSHVLRARCNFESKQAISITLLGRRPNNNISNPSVIKILSVWHLDARVITVSSVMTFGSSSDNETCQQQSTALSRSLLGKNLLTTIPKGNMGYWKRYSQEDFCRDWPNNSLLDCNVFNLIYLDWLPSFWIRRRARLIVQRFCSGFFIN